MPAADAACTVWNTQIGLRQSHEDVPLTMVAGCQLWGLLTVYGRWRSKKPASAHPIARHRVHHRRAVRYARSSTIIVLQVRCAKNSSMCRATAASTATAILTKVMTAWRWRISKAISLAASAMALMAHELHGRLRSDAFFYWRLCAAIWLSSRPSLRPAAGCQFPLGVSARPRFWRPLPGDQTRALVFPFSDAAQRAAAAAQGGAPPPPTGMVAT